MPNRNRESSTCADKRTSDLLNRLCAAPFDPACVSELGRLLESPNSRSAVRDFLDGLLSSESLSHNQRRASLLLGHMSGHAGHFRACVGELDITPALSDTTFLQGYAPPRRAQSIGSSLRAQMLLLEDLAGHKTLIVSADLFGFGRMMVGRIRRAAREWGIPPEAVVLNASHTHHAPGTVENTPANFGCIDEKYAVQVADLIGRSIDPLYAGLEPCFIYSTKLKTSTAVYPAMCGDALDAFQTDAGRYFCRATPVLTLDLIKSATSVIVLNLDSPSDPLGTSEVSAGIHGSLRDNLKRRGVAHAAMILRGATVSSKTIPGTNHRPRLMSARDVEHWTARMTEEILEIVAGPVRPVRGDIFAERCHANIKQTESGSRETVRDAADVIDARLAANSSDDEVQRIGTDDLPIPLETEIQLLALGSVTCLVGLTSSPARELAVNLVKHTNLPADCFLLGYTNGFDAELSTKRIQVADDPSSINFERIHDLRRQAAFSAEAILADPIDDLVSRWQTPGTANGFGRYHLAPVQGASFFCLSTGRCGTQTLKHILNTASNARVYHHPRPYLIDETLGAYHGTVESESVFWRARGDLIRDAWKDGFVFGELDHNMTPFSPVIAKTIPDARFLVMVRNPWDFVRSGMRRRYYSGNSWDSGRLRPEIIDENWASMSRFEKVCWLWNETYERAFTYLENISDARYRVVRFEDLVASPEESCILFDWLGLEGFSRDRISMILSQKLNRQRAGDFPKPENWTAEQHSALIRQCSRNMERFEYAFAGA